MDFRLPDIGEGLTEAEIVRWHVAEGDQVGLDHPLVSVETDKAVVEIPSPVAGVVVRHGAAEGDVVAVGAVLAVIGGTGAPDDSRGEAQPIVGTLSEDAQVLPPVAAGPRPVDRARALPRTRRLARDLGVDIGTVSGTGRAGRVTDDDVVAVGSGSNGSAVPGASVAPVVGPLVRRVAENLGVDIGTVRGTGPGGRVTRDDVVAAAVPARPPAPVLASDRGPDHQRQRMSKLRRTIAANMVRSWTEIPQVTAFDEVDVTRLVAVRDAFRSRHGVAIPLDALVVAAVVPVLRSLPQFNATLDGNDLIYHERIDMGIAVATPDGLLVATITDAAALDVVELAASIRGLGERARARSLMGDDLSPQTFTVSNIGAIGGGGHGTPLVPPDTVAIVSTGRATDKPVARQGRVEVAPLMPLSLSYDHRVVDGADGRRFLAMLGENLAEPALLLASSTALEEAATS
jgi:pyruvate/2-oxoglutarate dehydrogenase complex dihydrolipoamide acyltransferase (E2) component